jgi:hypothetical protein
MTHPTCSSYAEVELLDGQVVTLVGTYRQVDVRARPRPPAVFAGHAAVRLADGHDVLIEPTWSDRARRSPQEISRADGRRVAVTGVVRSRCPEPDEPAASIVGPCVCDVERVEVL